MLVEFEPSATESKNRPSGDKRSVVYGISSDRVRGTSLFIGAEWPYFVSIADVRILDARLSRFFVIGMLLADGHAPELCSIGYPAFALRNGHSLGVVEARPEELFEFEKWRRVLDAEFPRPDVTQQAAVLDRLWLQCPTCSDAWEEKDYFAIVRCPKCDTELNNPLWIARGCA